MKAIINLITIALFLSAITQAAHASDPLSPPGINESTRGTPAQVSNEPEEIENTNRSSSNEVDAGEKALETKHTGAKGYVHGLEIAHSSKNVQYMEDSDRDGQIQGKSSELDEITELPKWKLGSW